VRAAVYGAADVFRDQGADVRELEVPRAELSPIVGVIMLSEAYACHATDLRESLQRYGRQLRNRILMGALYSASEYIQAQRARQILRESIAAVMDRETGVDLLLTPGQPRAGAYV